MVMYPVETLQVAEVFCNWIYFMEIIIAHIVLCSEGDSHFSTS